MERLLVVANEFVLDARETLPDDILTLLTEAQDILVVAPALTTRLQSWVSDSGAAHAQADERVRLVLDDMRQLEGTSSGAPGDEDQLLAITDALAEFPANEILLAVHAPPHENYHERALAERVRDRFALPVSVVIVDGDGRVLSQRQEDARHPSPASTS